MSHDELAQLRDRQLPRCAVCRRRRRDVALVVADPDQWLCDPCARWLTASLFPEAV